MTRTSKTESTFQLEYAITIPIQASAAAIWARLTDAASFPAWNSTVTSIDGTIAEGQRLTIRVPVAPGRAFKPRVSRVEAERSMVWSDGMAPMFKGERTFTLTPEAGGTTRFEMREVFKGVMLPMIKGSLPDFCPIFEQYARDLKHASEAA